jgi:mannose-6-phosphate isomerase-like protein (cupin superfamily)
MLKQHSRRAFLQTAPLAAAVAALPSPSLAAQTPAPKAPESFRYLPASQLAGALAAVQARPGNFTVYEAVAVPFNAVLTTEEGRAAPEFEWHEGRDHLVQIVDGSTVYEIGGTPQNGHNTKPGEWLAPVSTGATTLHLKKGDWLIVPRGTPHKRTTADSVTFYLISTTGK